MGIQKDREWSEQITASHALPKHLLVLITDTLCNLGQIISSMRYQSWKQNSKSTQCQEKDGSLTSSPTFLGIQSKATTSLTRAYGYNTDKMWHIWDTCTSVRNHFHMLNTALSSHLLFPLHNNSEYGNGLDSHWQLVGHWSYFTGNQNRPGM